MASEYSPHCRHDRIIKVLTTTTPTVLAAGCINVVDHHAYALACQMACQRADLAAATGARNYRYFTLQVHITSIDTPIL